MLYVLSGALRSESATGSSDSEKFKKYFSINFILIGFFNNHKFVFCFEKMEEGLGVNSIFSKLLISNKRQKERGLKGMNFCFLFILLCDYSHHFIIMFNISRIFKYFFKCFFENLRFNFLCV